MWYFTWVLGTLLACSFAIISALAIELIEVDATNKTKNVIVDD